MANIIKVSPEKLNSTAGEIKNIQGSVLNITNEMTSLVQGMSSDWTGDASTAYIQKFSGLQDDMARISSMLNEHVTDLQNMSSTYAQAESAATSIGGGLASDVIS